MKLKVREFVIRLIDIVGALIGLIISAVPVLIISLFVKRDGGNEFLSKIALVYMAIVLSCGKFDQWLLMQKLFDKI